MSTRYSPPNYSHRSNQTLAQRAPTQPHHRQSAAEPLYTSWLPDDPTLTLRYWVPPRVGDICDTRFPDFLNDERSCVKIRPCLIVGVEEFASGQTIVQIAYGTSQVASGRRPGEIEVPVQDRRAHLLRDTKFDLRKVLELPFTNEFCPAACFGAFGVHPKRGRVEFDDRHYRALVDQAIRETRELGSLLEQHGHEARLKAHPRYR